MRTKIFPYVLNKVKQRNKAKYGRLTCELCGKPIGKDSFQFDHVVPVSKYNKSKTPFRKNSIRNLQVTHSKCNQLKSDIFNTKIITKTHH